MVDALWDIRGERSRRAISSLVSWPPARDSSVLTGPKGRYCVGTPHLRGLERGKTKWASLKFSPMLKWVQSSSLGDSERNWTTKTTVPRGPVAYEQLSVPFHAVSSFLVAIDKRKDTVNKVDALWWCRRIHLRAKNYSLFCLSSELATGEPAVYTVEMQVNRRM